MTELQAITNEDERIRQDIIKTDKSLEYKKTYANTTRLLNNQSGDNFDQYIQKTNSRMNSPSYNYTRTKEFI
jgi:hypothetical protein